MNHTYVAGACLTPGAPTLLRDGDELRLGRQIVSFHVRLYGPDATEAADVADGAGGTAGRQPHRLGPAAACEQHQR